MNSALDDGRLELSTFFAATDLSSRVHNQFVYFVRRISKKREELIVVCQSLSYLKTGLMAVRRSTDELTLHCSA